jgi:hypothetical protein
MKGFEGKDLTRAEGESFKSVFGDMGEGAEKMWKKLSHEQKKAYGWSGDITDTAGMEKAKEAFEDTFVEIIEANDKAFE